MYVRTTASPGYNPFCWIQSPVYGDTGRLWKVTGLPQPEHAGIPKQPEFRPQVHSDCSISEQYTGRNRIIQQKNKNFQVFKVK
jgi:hypothetical protein